MGKDYNSVDDNSSPTKKGFGRSLLAKKDKIITKKWNW